MKKCVLILLCAIVCSSCGNKVRYYDRGEVSSVDGIIYDTKTGKPFTGTYIHEFGFKGARTVIEVKNGKENGKMTTTQINGNYSVIYCFNGNRTGPIKYYNKNGNEISEEEYRNQLPK